MSIIKSLANRRSYYDIDKNMPVLENEIEEKIKAVTALVPDAFNSKSARVVIVLVRSTTYYGMKFTMHSRES